MSAYPSNTVELARRLGAATLHEAAGRIGALPSAIKPVVPTMVLCGPAFTVHCPPLSNLQIHHAIYRASAGDVLVVHVGDGLEAGYWGDILNEAAMARGLGGLVIDGGVRDTSGLAAMSFPVFSNGVSIQGTGKDYDAIGWLQAPIRVGKVIVNPGDLMMGDRDGVVALPQGQVNAILIAAQQRESDEAQKIERIRQGERTLDLYGFAANAPTSIKPGAPFRGRI
jgi:4-hydroxy-4-methyl-2-oxoglutarate aldolase